MKHAHKTLTLLLAACLALGCGDTPFQPTAATLDGAWNRLDEVPGSSEHWTLAVQGNSISGAGTWSGEACCSGTLTLVGSIVNDSVHIDVTLTTALGASPNQPDRHEHFEGALVTTKLLVGNASFENGTPAIQRLQKE
jgi:hypothetical protein